MGELCNCRAYRCSYFQLRANFESAGAIVFSYGRTFEVPQVRVFLFFLIFRRADEFFVIADVFKGTSAKSSENVKNADVDGDPSEKRSDV